VRSIGFDDWQGFALNDSLMPPLLRANWSRMLQANNVKEEKTMAKVDKDDSGESIINIDEKVGVNGINDVNDVMVIQAMLKYLTQFTKKWCTVSLPEPNGSLDKNTQRAIFDYQQHVRTNPNQAPHFWIAKDGAVSAFRPGLQLLRKQRLTIISMNDDCGLLNAALRDGPSHIDAIVMRWPFTVGVALGRNNPLFL
jgi:hypothetical protein